MEPVSPVTDRCQLPGSLQARPINLCAFLYWSPEIYHWELKIKRHDPVPPSISVKSLSFNLCKFGVSPQPRGQIRYKRFLEFSFHLSSTT